MPEAELRILARIDSEREIRRDAVDDPTALQRLIDRGILWARNGSPWVARKPTPEQEAELAALRTEVEAARDRLAMEVTAEQIAALPVLPPSPKEER